MKRVLGVLNGHDFPASNLLAWAESANRVIAADGALSRLLDLGFRPQLAVGDFDSVRPEHLENDISRISMRFPEDQSDADKLFELLRRESDYPIVAGIEGDRIDHVLYGLQAMAKLPRLRAITRQLMIRTVAKSAVQFQPKGPLISVLPITQCQVTLQGVRWPLKEAPLDPQGLRSLSNEAEGEVTLTVHQGRCLLMAECPDVDWEFLR